MAVRLRPRFPLGPPTWPTSVARPPVEKRTGVHYDTSWSRTYPARLARAIVLDDLLRPVVKLLSSPTVHGLEHIEDLPGPAIFAANHHSHLDTPLVLTSLPARFRHKTVVAAAADYFFSSRAKGAISVLTIAAIPMERLRVNRRSADIAARLMDEGWNLVIFPEGGRSEDGWGREFRGGAAYLALRCGRPTVPVHVEGTRRVLKKGDRYPTLVGSPLGTGRGVQVTFGRPLHPREGEDARRLAARVEAEVAALADESASDWWSARRRAARGTTPSLSGPAAGSWRRAWALQEHTRKTDTEPDWP
jgi:1-acyl-sn-glycerol-3-phosphate acyltransferase